jgi:arylsulfatase A-like enzyme
MHSPSSVCTPTRYGILTGRYCWRSRLKSGVLYGYSPNLIEPGRLTVASMLRAAGYQTAAFGKWHLGFGTRDKVDYSQPLRPGPLDHGFDRYFGIPASLDMEPYVYVDNDRAVEQPTSATPGSNSPRGVFWRPGPIAPSFRMEQVLPTITRRAVDFLRGPHRKPYFAYIPLTGPHTPWMPLEQHRGRSRAGIYGDFVAMVDDMLGQLLSAIPGQSDTLVIFTSDNGAHWTPEDKTKFRHRANAGWRGQKADVWDAGHRIPFLARWPGRIQPGAVSNELGCLTDFLATAADLVGVTLPRDAAEDSYSLLPALLGQGRGTPIREAIVHHSVDGMFSIRQGKWKLELGLGSGGFTKPAREQPRPGGPAGQLYDLKTDPAESKNLYLQQPEIVARLSALLDKYQQQGYSRPM